MDLVAFALPDDVMLLDTAPDEVLPICSVASSEHCLYTLVT